MVDSIKPIGMVGEISGEFDPSCPISAATLVVEHAQYLKLDDPVIGNALKAVLESGAELLNPEHQRTLEDAAFERPEVGVALLKLANR